MRSLNLANIFRDLAAANIIMIAARFHNVPRCDLDQELRFGSRYKQNTLPASSVKVPMLSRSTIWKLVEASFRYAFDIDG